MRLNTLWGWVTEVLGIETCFKNLWLFSKNRTLVVWRWTKWHFHCSLEKDSHIYDPSSSCWIYQVGLFLSLGSCLIVARIQNNRLVIVQLQLKQTDLLLNRQQIVHFQDVGASWPWRSGDDPSWVHFLYSLSPSLGSAFCKRQMDVCLRPIREVGSVWAHAK